MNSFSGNPASLANLAYPGISVTGVRRFMLAELGSYHFSASFPASSGNFGMALHYSGFAAYHEMQLELAYGIKLAGSLDMGGQVHFVTINMQGYGKRTAPGFEWGLMFHPAENLHAGFKARDPVGKKYGRNRDERLPSLYVFGLGYEPSSQFLCSIEISKEENRQAEASARVQYHPHPSLRIRVGTSLIHQVAWFGVGWTRKNIRIDIFSSFHTRLGISPGLQWSFLFPSKEK